MKHQPAALWGLLIGSLVANVVLSARGANQDSQDSVKSLQQYLAQPTEQRGKLAELDFAATALSRADAERCRELLWHDHVTRIRRERAEEMKARELKRGMLKMPFYYKVFGEKPEKGRSLYISMHGGGGTTQQVNDQQWENQKRLYSLREGVYVAPRAPTNTWNLWHQGHIDPLFDRLIENLIVFENVDPNRVYLMGYSAGGDGVYQLAPRMADRFAAAAMMAGHPNETSPLGLRNLPFTLHVGGRDAAYNRNNVARAWGKKLDALHKADPDGYEHLVKIYPNKGHWLDREDAAAIPWMAKFRRNTFPKRIVWKQDDVVHHRFYWLAVDLDGLPPRAEIVASRDAQRIDLQPGGVKRIAVRLNDQMVDLDQPVTITVAGNTAFQGRAQRTIAVLAKTLQERGDPAAVFSSEVTVQTPQPPASSSGSP